ncbi:MAG: PIN domain-containing protein [Deltaproteobacteria bacterium]|nr:PIN domain-containing protein [Deltaproteobacteria bacterium]
MPNLTQSIFIDTSAFIALRDSKDINHPRAKSFLKEIKNKRIILFTTNFIFDEVYTYFCRFHNVAVEMGEYIRNSPGAIVYNRITTEDENPAWEIAKSYKDKTFSFTDCTTFSICERLGIKDVFAFDEHFKQYGKFNVLP